MDMSLPLAVTPDPDTALFDLLVQTATAAGTSRTAASELATTLTGLAPSSSAIILLTGDVCEPVAQAVAVQMARWQANDDDVPDLIPADPEGTSWTVADVDSRIILPASRQPQTRWIMPVSRSQTFKTGAADRLLKVWEEPPSPLLVLLCAPLASQVPITLRSRCLNNIHTPLADVEQRRASLMLMGVSSERATQLVELCGQDTHLALNLALSNDMPLGCLQIRANLADPSSDLNGFIGAHQAAQACLTLGQKIGTVSTAKSNARVLAATALAQRTQKLIQLATEQPERAHELLQSAVACDKASGALLRNAPLAASLALAL